MRAEIRAQQLAVRRRRNLRIAAFVLVPLLVLGGIVLALLPPGSGRGEGAVSASGKPSAGTSIDTGPLSAERTPSDPVTDGHEPPGTASLPRGDQSTFATQPGTPGPTSRAADPKPPTAEPPSTTTAQTTPPASGTTSPHGPGTNSPPPSGDDPTSRGDTGSPAPPGSPAPTRPPGPDPTSPSTSPGSSTATPTPTPTETSSDPAKPRQGCWLIVVCS